MSKSTAARKSSSRRVRIMSWSRPSACFRIVVAQPTTSRATVVPETFKTRKAAAAFAKKQRLVVS
jgi:hypothetical protein